MQVEVRAFGGLERYIGGARSGETRTVEVPESITIQELLEREGIPGEEVHMMLLNGKHAQKDSVLNPGDQLVLFPLIEGG